VWRGGGLERRCRGGRLTGAARAVLQGGAQAAQPLGDPPALAALPSGARQGLGSLVPGGLNLNTSRGGQRGCRRSRPAARESARAARRAAAEAGTACCLLGEGGEMAARNGARCSLALGGRSSSAGAFPLRWSTQAVGRGKDFLFPQEPALERGSVLRLIPSSSMPLRGASPLEGGLARITEPGPHAAGP
jgi:hypothetical protein